MQTALRFLRLPATPFILLLAILLGLSLAVVTFLLTGVRGSLNYMEIPVVQGALDQGEPADRTVFDWHALRGDIVPLADRPPAFPPIEPSSELMEASPFGQLPKVDENGNKAWQTYRNREAVQDGRPRIGVILTELGLMEDSSRQAADLLPPSVSLAYSSYASELDLWLRHGRFRGHDVFLEIPVQSADPAIDNGPMALGSEEVVAALSSLLGSASGYMGIAAEAGIFANDPAPFSELAKELESRGLAFIELGSDSLAPAALAQGLPYLPIETAIDDVLDRNAIEQQLGLLEGKAIQEGQAFAYFRPYPISLDAVWQWSQKLQQKGLVLAPLGQFLEASAVLAEQANDD